MTVTFSRARHDKESCVICGRKVRGMKLHYRAVHNARCKECHMDRFDESGEWHSYISHAVTCSKFVRDVIDRQATSLGAKL